MYSKNHLRHYWLISLFSVAALLPAIAAETEDVLHFFNGDLLHGSIVSAGSGQELSWKRNDSKRAITITPKNIDKIKMAAGPQGSQGQHSSTIRLTNGDVINANIVSMDADGLAVTTEYAGDLRIKRLMIASILPGKQPGKNFFNGPGELTDWTLSSANTWKIANGALQPLSSGTIGRNVGLPDQSKVSFDISWRGSYPQFRMALYTDNLRSYSQNSYVLRMSSSYIRFYRYNNNSSTSLENANFRVKPGKTKANFCILTDKKAKTMSLMIDGVMVKQWSDPSGFKQLGKGLLFYAYSNAAFKIRNISVSEWNGTLPGSNEEAEQQKEDCIELTVGDRLSGVIQTIKEGNITFKAPYSSFDIPLEKTSSLTFSSKSAERARRNTNDIKAQLAHGSEITLDMDSLKNGKLTGKSENFGSISISKDAISLLDFNIYREKDEDKEEW